MEIQYIWYALNKGYNSNICPGNTKLFKDTDKLVIYEKYINYKNNHSILDINLFRNYYKRKDYKSIDMNNKIFQKDLMHCLFEENSINVYIHCVQKFKSQFPINAFILNEENIKKNLIYKEELAIII